MLPIKLSYLLQENQKPIVSAQFYKQFSINNNIKRFSICQRYLTFKGVFLHLDIKA